MRVPGSERRAILRQARQVAGQGRRVHLRLPDHPGPTHCDQRVGVGRLVIVGGVGKGHQDRGHAGHGELAHGGRPGATQGQVAPCVRGGHVLDEGRHLRLDPSAGVVVPHGLLVVDAGLVPHLHRGFHPGHHLGQGLIEGSGAPTAAKDEETQRAHRGVGGVPSGGRFDQAVTNAPANRVPQHPDLGGGQACA